MDNSEVEFTLRRVRMEDKVNYSKHGNNKKIWDNMRDRFPHPYTEERAEEWIKQSLSKEGPQSQFTIDVNGEAIGGIGIFVQEDVHRKNAEIGYWLSEDYWGKGIMAKALKKVVPYIFETFDVVRIYATPFSKGLASMKVLKKVGFKEEAVLKNAIYKNDTFYDEHIYSILKEDYYGKSEESASKET